MRNIIFHWKRHRPIFYGRRIFNNSSYSSFPGFEDITPFPDPSWPHSHRQRSWTASLFIAAHGNMDNSPCRQRAPYYQPPPLPEIYLGSRSAPAIDNTPCPLEGPLKTIWKVFSAPQGITTIHSIPPPIALPAFIARSKAAQAFLCYGMEDSRTDRLRCSVRRSWRPCAPLLKVAHWFRVRILS